MIYQITSKRDHVELELNFVGVENHINITFTPDNISAVSLITYQMIKYKIADRYIERKKLSLLTNLMYLMYAS